MFENVLPIGSVVLLKNALKKTMVIGYMQVSSNNPEKLYDYAGIMYPVGILGAESQILFDHEEIQDIVFKGYANTEFDELIAALRKEADKTPEFADAVKTKKIGKEDV